MIALKYFIVAFALAPLLIVDNNSPTRVSALNFSPASLAFAPQVVSPMAAAASASQTITVTNSGNADATITSIVASADYSETNDCPATLSVNATCRIQVTFTPNSLGTINGAVTVISNAAPGSQTVGLSGIGLAPAGFSLTVLDFGTVTVGTTSIVQTATVTNQQSTNLALKGISATGDYFQMNNCPASLTPGQTCNVDVTFVPTVIGFIGGALTLVTDSTLGTQSIELHGEGSGTTTSQVSLSVAGFVFPNQEAGTTSSAQTLTLTNTSTTTSLTVASVTSSSENYLESDSCVGPPIPPGGTCTITVKFQPIQGFAPLTYPGAITVLDSDSASPQVVFLTSTAVAPLTAWPDPVPLFTLLPSQTAAQTTTITNNHAATEDVAVAVGGPFTLNSNCPNSIPAGATCSVVVVVKNDGSFIGSANRALTINASSGGFLSPRVVNISACLADVVLSPPTLNFGAVPLGKTSEPQTATFFLPTGIANIANVSVGGPQASNFAIANNTCGQSATGLCTVQVTFTPNAPPSSPLGTLNFTDDHVCSPQEVTLLGSRAGPYVITVGGFSGSGTVTSIPAGLNCNFDTGNPFCTGSFASGTTVTLAATPDPGHDFEGWSGACTGPGSCMLNMTADKQVTATFVAPDFSVAASPVSPGTVTPGTPAKSTVTVTSSDNFNSAVNFTCSVNPSPALAPTCLLSPPSATLTPNGLATSSLTIDTTPPGSALLTPVGRNLSMFYAFWLPVGGFAWIGVGFSLKPEKKKLTALCLCSLLVVPIALQIGCGGTRVVNQTPGTPSGVYTITVIGVSGQIQHSTTVTLAVQ